MVEENSSVFKKTNIKAIAWLVLILVCFVFAAPVFAQSQRGFGYGASNSPVNTLPEQANPRAFEATGRSPRSNNKPKQLFDIRLILDKNSLTNSKDLVARVTFDNFGQEPTPVEMTFNILDKNGSRVYRSTDSTTVETQAVFAKRFNDAPSLAQGEYTLRLETLYNTDVTDSFDASFTIIGQSQAQSNTLPYILAATGALIVLAFAIKGLSGNKK